MGILAQVWFSASPSIPVLANPTLHSGPPGALAMLLIAVAIPFSFPYPGPARFFRTLISEKAWRRVDFLGAFTSLAASIVLVFALEQAGVEYPWNSAPIVVSFVLSGVLWVAFIGWERAISLKNGACEPMFPWRLACSRFVLGLLL